MTLEEIQGELTKLQQENNELLAQLSKDDDGILHHAARNHIQQAPPTADGLDFGTALTWLLLGSVFLIILCCIWGS